MAQELQPSKIQFAQVVIKGGINKSARERLNQPRVNPSPQSFVIGLFRPPSWLKTGQGQFIDVSLLQVAIAFIESHVSDYLNDRSPPL